MFGRRALTARLLELQISLRKNWRRRPDLNRGWRFCRPLPYHLATAPLEGARSINNEAHLRSLRELRWATFAHDQGEGWSGKRDSNPRLRPWQGRTLPLSYSRSLRTSNSIRCPTGGSSVTRLNTPRYRA